jgi:hypothetical protein
MSYLETEALQLRFAAPDLERRHSRSSELIAFSHRAVPTLGPCPLSR